MTDKITRRRAIIRSGKAALAVGGAAVLGVPAKAESELRVIAPLAPALAAKAQADLSACIRSWFANRCPLFARLPWIPVERVDFLCYSHRWASNEENRHFGNPPRTMTVGSAFQQYCQTFQFPVQVSGSAQTARAQVLPGGIQSPFDFNQTVQLQNMVDDIEMTMCYGVAMRPKPYSEDPYSPARTGGLREQLKTHNFGPSIWSEIGVARLIPYAVQQVRLAGGRPETVVISTETAIDAAANGRLHRMRIGDTMFGTPINGYVSHEDDLRGITFIEAPLLHRYDAFVLSANAVYVRDKIGPEWVPQANGGMWQFEGAIDVCQEHHHAYIHGE